MIGLSTGWIGMIGCSAIAKFSEFMHLHYFVPAGIDHLHRDAPVLAGRERKRNRATECLESLRIHNPRQGLAEFVPRNPVGKESLRNAEGAAIVVAVQEPGGDLVSARSSDAVVDRVIDVHSFHGYCVFSSFVRVYSRSRLTEYAEQLAPRLLL